MNSVPKDEVRKEQETWFSVHGRHGVFVLSTTHPDEALGWLFQPMPAWANAVMRMGMQVKCS